MKTEIKALFNLNHFFKIVDSSSTCITYHLRKPSQMLVKNIHNNWLQYIYSKTHKDMPVYINQAYKNLSSTPIMFGNIQHNLEDLNELMKIEYKYVEEAHIIQSLLQLDLFVPKEDAMQYFVRWQRYRKYWWSSISTTPSLFAIKDIKYEDNSANVDIIAQLPFGEQPVENVSIKFAEKNKYSRLSCHISLIHALNILLLDGLHNNTKEEYLRLHRKMAPYKISFGLDYKESDKKETLKELATLLYHKFESNKISTWIPEFTLPFEAQIKENLHLGTTYTAILSEDTLKNGIFRLMNSSTMLAEQVHVADCHKYAALLFEN